MKITGASLLFITAVIGCAAPIGPSSHTHAEDVFLTMDPDTKLPTIVAETELSTGQPIRFKSINYTTSADAEPFIIRFGLDFKDAYNATASSASAVTSTGVVFTSQRNNSCTVKGGGTVQCQEVKIKLDPNPQPPHPDAGYKYEVVMAGKVLDPRVRPR